MPLDTKISVSVVSSLKSALDLVTADAPLVYKKEFTWPSGTGADQADRLFHDSRQLAASASENLDLAGVLTDAFGATLTFVEVLAILIFAKATNVNDVVIGGHATAAFVNWVADATDKIKVRPGGLLLLIARDTTGYAVTAATGDLLTVANSAGGSVVDYDVIIIGRSA